MPKILVVEDSNMMQVYYTQILSRMPSCQFSFVKNGQEALDHIDRKGPPDVVVLDINMPVMDGLEFLGRFRAGRPTPPAVVIIVSTEGREDDLKRGMEAGASAYLRKPFRPEALQELISGLIIPQVSRPHE
jgi:two-component system, chemotaxis family, chemotaxis protein CheY